MDPEPKTTPKDFFLWAGAMLAFYWSIIAFIALVFHYLDYAMPDALQFYPINPYSSGISFEMASIIVLFPIFLVLMRVIRTSIAQDSTRADIWVRRWMLYILLFVAGITIAADLITLIRYFFDGDVTLRFALKIIVVLLVAGAVFLHFLADLRGYWRENFARARSIGYATGVLAIVTIVSGFFILGTPWQARLYQLDMQKVADLSSIQTQVVDYWRAKEVLPSSLSDLQNSISGYVLPTDSQTHKPYEYRATGNLSFELCADFNAQTQPYSRPSVPQESLIDYSPSGVSQAEDLWYHGSGHTCFIRTIDPQLTPPYSNSTTLPTPKPSM